MPIIRGPNQNKPSENSEAHSVSEKTQFSGNAKDPYDEKTVAIGRHSPAKTMLMQNSGAHPIDDDEKTHVIGTHRHGAEKPQVKDFLDNPVVGWLVVIDGPGKGSAAQIGYGQNSIGREPGQRIQLNYGDDEISRKEHAFITYDPKGRKFYIQNGTGVNLIYLNQAPVLSPTELSGGMDITLGNTTLRFIPFCGGTFDWYNMVVPNE